MQLVFVLAGVTTQATWDSARGTFGKVCVHARKTLELVFAIATAPLGEEEGYIAKLV
jgi:hypothetical protein